MAENNCLDEAETKYVPDLCEYNTNDVTTKVSNYLYFTYI